MVPLAHPSHQHKQQVDRFTHFLTNRRTDHTTVSVAISCIQQLLWCGLTAQNVNGLQCTHLKHRDQFLLWYADTVSVHAINDIDDGVCVGIVAAPVWPDACLTAEVPDLELKVLVLHRLHVEADRCKQSRIHCLLANLHGNVEFLLLPKQKNSAGNW